VQKNTGPVVLATFSDHGRAEKAIDALEHAGFREDQVGIVGKSGRVEPARTASSVVEHNAAEGAVAGAVTGGALGAAAGVAATLLLPGIGAVLTGGALTAILAATAAGAAGGSLVGPFLAMGLSKEEAELAERHFHAGRTVVVVRCGDRSPDEVRELLNRFVVEGDQPIY
jgi:hypothetical protein